MGNHWFVYKKQKQKGPYTWEKLWREAQAGRIGPKDLVWNKTMKDWVQASQVPGLITNPRKRNYLTMALVLSAVFFFVLSGTAFYYLFFYTGPQLAAVEEEAESAILEGPLDEENSNETASPEPDNRANLNQNRQDPASEPDRNDEPEPVPAEPEEGSISYQGGTYEGPLKDGQPHGFGTWTHPDGRKYEGDFVSGRMEGYGTMTFPGGERYTGFFKDGMAHGEGTMIHPDGREVSGTWFEGTLQEDDEPDENDDDNNDDNNAQ